MKRPLPIVGVCLLLTSAVQAALLAALLLRWLPGSTTAAGFGTLFILQCGLAAALFRPDPREQRLRALLRRLQTEAGAAPESVPSAEFDPDALENAVDRLVLRLKTEDAAGIEQRQAIEQANRNYMEMLGFVTSELRSTVSAALFNAHLLKDGSYGPFTGEQAEGVDSILEGLESLDEITKNYLQLSRIERGEMHVDRTDTDLLEDVVRPVLVGFEPQLNKREMPVRVNLPIGLRVPGDIALLRVVYENLLGNALRYGKPGGAIELAATTGSDWVTLSVTNEGREMPENALSSLFRKFQHYDSGAQQTPKGPGLGLFIVQQIVSVHGGKVRIDSQPALGTRVSFTLPL